MNVKKFWHRNYYKHVHEVKQDIIFTYEKLVPSLKLSVLVYSIKFYKYFFKLAIMFQEKPRPQFKYRIKLFMNKCKESERGTFIRKSRDKGADEDEKLIQPALWYYSKIVAGFTMLATMVGGIALKTYWHFWDLVHALIRLYLLYDCDLWNAVSKVDSRSASTLNQFVSIIQLAITPTFALSCLSR